MKVFCDRLKELRGATSQKAFASLLKLNQQTYQRYESGVREPDLETLHLIGVSFGVSIDWLLGLSDARDGSAKPAAQKIFSPQPDLLREIRELKKRVNALESSSSMACG